MGLVGTDNGTSPGRENETGYLMEEFFQDYSAECADRMMRDYVTNKTQEVIGQSQSLNELSDKAEEEAVATISSGINDYADISGKINYDDKGKIIRMIKAFIKTFDMKADLKFNDTYLAGKSTNILGMEKDTEALISSLSMLLTDKHFSTQFGGEELVEIF